MGEGDDESNNLAKGEDTGAEDVKGEGTPLSYKMDVEDDLTNSAKANELDGGDGRRDGEEGGKADQSHNDANVDGASTPDENVNPR